MSKRATRPRVVFDCNIYVQAIAFADGPAADALRLMESGDVELFISKATLSELRRVLGYEEVRAMSPGMTPVLIGAFLDRLTFRATLQRRVRRAFRYQRDPDDEPYLDLAAAAKANYLVTRDKDLLSLMTGHTAFCKEFRRRTHPLVVLDPVAFLEAMHGR